jgi:hypothetical protein
MNAGQIAALVVCGGVLGLVVGWIGEGWRSSLAVPMIVSVMAAWVASILHGQEPEDVEQVL